MSFGFSIGDFALLVKLAHDTFRACREAGAEYNQIASEVRYLHIVLRILRDDEKSSDSKILRQGSSTTAQLGEIVDGCNKILTGLHTMLAKYNALEVDSRAGAAEKLWHQLGFAAKLGELGGIRLKLINYTSIISVLIDKMQLQGIERVERKVEGGFGEVKAQVEAQFALLRKDIFSIASQQRAEERMGATVSSLSLSTYAGDEKTVWQDFRRTLIARGYTSESLERNKDVLLAYMMRLDQSGVLDQAPDTAMVSLGSTPWSTRRTYLETNSSADLQPTIHSHSATAAPLDANEGDSTSNATPLVDEALAEAALCSNAPQNMGIDSAGISTTEDAPISFNVVQRGVYKGKTEYEAVPYKLSKLDYALLTRKGRRI